MSVSLLLITHNDIGQSLLKTVTNMMGVAPIACQNLAVTSSMDVEQGITQAKILCENFGEHDDILIVTDIYGSTPSNIALKLLEKASTQQKLIITGINLPMLVKIMNYASLDLAELSKKACSGASESIFVIQ